MIAQRHVITQGEHCVLADPNAEISTLLGSCVACCLWDDVAGVGGMNHMLLAANVNPNGVGDLVGVNAMELLINDLQKMGATRSRLKAKAFGGAQMVSGLSDIGPSNVQFLLEFLDKEGIPCISRSVGGHHALHVLFVPATGAARVKRRTVHLSGGISHLAEPVGNDLELF